MMMDRHCGPCDSKYLDLVKAITLDDTRTRYSQVYFVRESNEKILDGDKLDRLELYKLRLKYHFIGMTIVIIKNETEEMRLLQFAPEDPGRSEVELRRILKEL